MIGPVNNPMPEKESTFSTVNHLPVSSSPLTRHRTRYLLLFCALVLLTVMTIASTLIPFQNEVISVSLAIGFAIVKGGLISMFFMHLRFEERLIWLIVLAPLLLAIVLLCALIPDGVFTAADSTSASMHLFNPPAIPHARSTQ